MRMWTDEQIKTRSNAYKVLQKGRNRVMTQQLYEKLKQRLTKSEKENILRQIRRIERDLGLKSERYNGSARNTTTSR